MGPRDSSTSARGWGKGWAEKPQRGGRNASGRGMRLCRQQHPAHADGWYLYRPGGRNPPPHLTRGSEGSAGVTSHSAEAPLKPRAGDQLGTLDGRGPPDTGKHHPQESKQRQTNAGLAAIVQQGCLRTEPAAGQS